MRKREDDAEVRREIMHALAMILQIGLAILTCMGMSMAIGYYIDRLFGTKMWVPIMLVVGILASMRSMLVLTGHYRPGGHSRDQEKQEKRESADEDSQDNFD